MKKTNINNCPQCPRLQAQLDELKKRCQQLELDKRQLQEDLAEAKKNSSTSNKPPSSDIVKPPKPPADPNQPKNAPGGQPGHEGHERKPLPQEKVNRIVDHRLSQCPDCGGPLTSLDEPPRTFQQIDLTPFSLFVEEHRCHKHFCPHCQKSYSGALPGRIEKGGLLGPHVTALIAFLKGPCHAPFSTIRKFCRDVLKLPLSRGVLVKVIRRVTAALDGPYEELLRLLPDERLLNVDETGHKLNGEHWWTWCFRAELYVLYRIDPHRNAEVLMEVLGKEFAGVLGCDYFPAYRRFMRECNIVVQFCLAHLIRDVKFLTTLPTAAEKLYGERLREALRELFHLIHNRDQYSPRELEKRLQAQRQRIIELATTDVPSSKPCQAMAKRFQKHGDSYFTFLTTPGMAPTNNVAEQAIRFVVIDRHVTQGTRSEAGNRWSERIWTVLATCAIQGKSVYDFLQACVQSYWDGTPQPSLL